MLLPFSVMYYEIHERHFFSYGTSLVSKLHLIVTLFLPSVLHSSALAHRPHGPFTSTSRLARCFDFHSTPSHLAIRQILLYRHSQSPNNMSTFGAPGTGVKIGKPNPPARGSFPLDHDAECQPLMKEYLKCLKSARGVNSPECRELSKGYLNCRMERGLMAPDEMKNLGYGEGQTVSDQKKEK